MNKLARLSVQFVATFARTWANWRKPPVLANVATANSLFETAACFCVLGLWCCAVGGFLSGSAVFAQPTAGKGPSISELAVKSPHTALFNISDGTANTVFGGMVSENRAVPWTKPDDLVFDDTFQTKENSLVEGAVMFADGSIRHMQIQDGLDRAKFRLLFSIGDGQPSPLTSLYPPDHKFAPLTYKSVQDQVRQAEARSENKNSLKAIMLAFHNHHQVFKHFPPATVFGPDGKPWHSWRVLILPYLGQKELYDQYDATVPWDHPKNAAVLNKMPKVYRDPLSDQADSNTTRYLLVTGAGTAFPTKPTGNVVVQVPAQPNPAQPAPPKPVAKDGRQPIEYQPFNPAPWKAKNQSTWLFPWEGERVVLLTTTADLDPKTMAAFVKQLDAAWKLCGEFVGQSPNLNKQHNGKVTIAAVPDSTFTLNAGNKFGFGFFGSGGMEVAEFYGPQGDYERVRKDPDSLPDHYFYLIGQNHSVALDRMSFAVNGSALLLRHICMEGLKSTDSETQARQSVVRYENAFAQSQATFAESFGYFGARTPLPLNDIDGKPFAAGDLSLLFASCLLKVRQENGGNEWVKRFYRHLSECPPVVARQANEIASIANGQLLNWVIAASLAASKDLSPQFRDRWRFPLAPETWNALKAVDWKKPGQTSDNVFDVMPIEHLPIGVAMTRPAFLTAERKKQNLIVGGTFEDGSGGTWKVNTWRQNSAAAAVVSGEAKEGRKSVVIRLPLVADDAMYEQKVAIKPNTRYLASGWIKTKDVVVVEPGGQRGANLSLEDWNGEVSRSFQGTNDWSYITLVFDSGQRTEVTIRARLGYFASTVTGVAWFDDLCLIAIGETPARPTAQPPAATITTNKDWKGWPKDAPPPAIAPFDAAQAKQHQEAWAKHLGVPVEYTNSIGMKFRLIPPGEYLRGCSPEEISEGLKATDAYWGQFLRTSGPQHKVILTQPLYLGLYEVTQESYSKIMGNNPAHFAPTGPGRGLVAGKQTGKFPVERVSWNDAVDFCVKLSEREKLKPCYSRAGDAVTLRIGNGYRLPTEAEWEFACRAGTITTFWNGNSVDEYAQIGRHYLKKEQGRTHEVGELKTNPFGLFDIHGNVWEFAQDGWSPTTYRQFANTPAIDPSLLPSGNSMRPIRGGSWMDVPTTSTSGSRLANAPTSRDYINVGFRASLSVEAVKAALANPVQAEAPLVEISGKELRRFEGHQGPVSKAVFSSDGKRVLSGSGFPNGDSTMRLWDAETGREIRKFGGEGQNWVFGVALSPDGKQAFSGNSDGLRLWDVETGAVLRRMEFESSNKTVLTVAFSPDGKRAVSGGVDRVVRVWDLASGTQIRTLTGHLGRVMSVAFSPDGSQTVSCGLDEDKTVRLWNTETGKEMLRLEGHTAGVESVAFTPDGSRIVSSAFDGLILWDVKAGKLIRKIAGDGTDLLEAVFFPDGRRVFSGSKSGRVSIWDSETGQELQRLAEGSEWVWTVAVSPDGLRGVSAGGSSNINGKWVDGKDFAIRLWSLADSNKSERVPVATTDKRPARVTQATQDDPLTVSLRGHEHAVLSLAVSPDGKSLASGDLYGSVLVWNVADRKLKFELPGTAGENIAGLAFSPDGKLIATGNGKSVKVRDATNGQELKTLSGHTDLIWSVAFSSDSKRLASGSHDKSVKVWDIAKGEELTMLTGQDGAFLSVAFSPDGKWLAGATSYGESYVMLWDTRAWKESQRLSPINGQVWSIAFSPDSQRLVTANDSGRAVIWDVQSGDELLSLQDRRGQQGQDHMQRQRDKQMKSVAFNHDGSRIVTAADSGVIKIWDAKTGQKLHELSGRAKDARGAVFSPDGKWVASGGGDSLVKIWTLTGRPQADSDGTIVKALVDPQKAQAEWQALQGTWRLTNAADYANRLPPELAIKDAHLIIKGETATVLIKNFVMGYLLTIDPTQSPKALDMLGAEDIWRESLSMGIYSLERDTLQIAWQPYAIGRPKELMPATPPAKESPDQLHGGGMAMILKFERMNEPLPRVESVFDLASWQKASRELNKLRVRVQLGKFEPLDQEETAGPGYIGVVDLPVSPTDGTVPADIWKSASSMNFIACSVSGLTDATLRQLTTHRGLYGLSLHGKSSATKEGLRLLKALPSFEYLSLTEVPQTVEILTALAESSDLRIIEISGASPSSDLLAAIARFKKLEVLMLNEIDLTDNILIELSKLPSLRKLTLPKSKNFNLDKPEVSDKGLQAVKAMKKLKRLEMFGHGIDNLKLHDINEQLRAPK